MSARLLVAALVLAASPALAAAPPDEGRAMAGAVTAFYAVHAHTDQDGIPDAATRAKYAPTVSPRLLKQLEDGEAAETRYARANKNVPPLVEGDLFSPNFEGITSFRVGACDPKKGTCALEGHYQDARPRPQDKPVDWTDTVYLVRTPAGWKVDDIAYGGAWEFGNHGKLSELLKSIIRDSYMKP
ncbi:MAG TPA: hypothetical protein VMH86_04760 [Rhizomicrobium sp.]|nr:hypothetical protein [Rhizomicrobium sp.]